MSRLLSSKLVWVLILGTGVLTIASWLLSGEVIDLDEAEDDYAYGEPDGEVSEKEAPSLVD